MVQVAAGRRPVAARGGTSSVSGGDQVPQFAAGPVAGVGLGMMARATDDGVEREVPQIRGAAVPAGGTGVRGGGAVWVQGGQAPVSSRAAGGGVH